MNVEMEVPAVLAFVRMLKSKLAMTISERVRRILQRVFSRLS